MYSVETPRRPRNSRFDNVANPFLQQPGLPFAQVPELLTCPGSFLTTFGPRFGVETEAEVGFRYGHIQGVDLIT